MDSPVGRIVLKDRLVTLIRSRTGKRTIWTFAAIGASAIGAFLLILAFRGLDWGGVQAAFAEAKPWYFVFALILVLIAYYLRGARWRLLFREHQVNTTRLVLVENTAIGVNSLTPIPILDEPVRVGLMMLQGVPAGTVLATMATMRTFELAVQAAIGLTGLIFLDQLQPLKPLFLAATAVSVAALIALFTIGPLMRRIPAIGRLKLAQDFSMGVDVMRKEPIFPFMSLLMTGVYAITIGLSGWMLGLAFELDMSILALIIVSLAVIFFTDWIPALPLAVGSFEFVALYLLGLWDVSNSVGMGFAIILHAIFFIPPILVAATYLPFVGIRSIKQIMSLLNANKQSSGVVESRFDAPGGHYGR